MMRARSHLSCAALGQELYVVGGWDMDYIDSLEIYTVAEDRWRTGPALPSPVANGAMVRAGPRLLVLGGNTDLREKNSVVFSLEEDQQEWREEHEYCDINNFHYRDTKKQKFNIRKNWRVHGYIFVFTFT